MSTYPKFRTGDRVTRLSNVFLPDSYLMHGTICARYKDTDSQWGPYPELYAVIWDGSKRIKMGYLPHGLDKE